MNIDEYIRNIDNFQVGFRTNYGLKNPNLPISFPPPKYGAAQITQNSSILIIGGSSSSNIVGNDVWTWDTSNTLIFTHNIQSY
jgi:hypothetical protein